VQTEEIACTNLGTGFVCFLATCARLSCILSFRVHVKFTCIYIVSYNLQSSQMSVFRQNDFKFEAMDIVQSRSNVGIWHCIVYNHNFNISFWAFCFISFSFCKIIFVLCQYEYITVGLGLDLLFSVQYAGNITQSSCSTWTLALSTA